MTRILDVLTKTLESLDENDFDRFRFNLWSRGPITRQKLEKASVEDTLAMMVQAYCEMKCGSVVLDILKKMNLNQLALDLEKDLQSGKLLLHRSILSWLEVMEFRFRLQCVCESLCVSVCVT